MELYVLDKNLETVGLVDEYKSLIWTNRYAEVGDCELYMPATSESLSLLKMGYYLMRSDDDMVCQIRKIELDTDAEEGNYIVVSGTDVKAFLDQRIIWGTMTCKGNVETFLRSLVETTLCDPALTSRKLVKQNGGQMMFLGSLAGFTEKATEQISYANVGEKVREYCTTYQWGYRVVYRLGALYFELYKGTDRTDSVIFADEYENLASTKYIEDDSSLGNVALVAGEGAGADRARSTYGYGEGVDRHELFVDARDVSRSLSYAELLLSYPLLINGGQGYVSGLEYKLAQLDIEIIDGNQRAWLDSEYSGTFVTISGVEYFRLTNITIADLADAVPDDNTAVSLRDIVYSGYLLSMGDSAVSSYGSKTSFEGSVIPDVTFVYKRDYFLGDQVSVRNEYNLSAEARIVEVVEVEDDNGYSIEPHFEYIQTSGVNASVPAGQAIDYDAGAQTMEEAAISAGFIAALSASGVRFSNGMRISANRVTNAVLDSTSGTQVGNLYEYTITLSVSGSLVTLSGLPIFLCGVYSNDLGKSFGAHGRFVGQSGAWTGIKINFLYPESTMSGTFTVDYFIRANG